MAATLDELWADRMRCIWTLKADEAFELLKKCLSVPPLLAYLDTKTPFIVFVDAFQVVS